MTNTTQFTELLNRLSECKAALGVITPNFLKASTTLNLANGRRPFHREEVHMTQQPKRRKAR